MMINNIFGSQMPFHLVLLRTHVGILSREAPLSGNGNLTGLFHSVITAYTVPEHQSVRNCLLFHHEVWPLSLV